MNYPLIAIADKNYEIKDMLMRDLLNMAKVPSHFYERQLSYILRSIIGQNTDAVTGKPINVDHLTCEERYAIFLTYLEMTRDSNDLSETIQVSQFLTPHIETFSKDRVSGDYGISVRHLNGVEAQALEGGCQDTKDWILGAMAITIGCEQLPPIDMITSIEFCGKMIKNRMELLENLEVNEFNQLMHEYLELQHQQDHLVNIAFDNGIVLERISKRGTDDAPVRFQPFATFTGYAKELLSSTARKNSEL